MSLRTSPRCTRALLLALAGWISAPLAPARAADAAPPGRVLAFSHVAVKATHYEQSVAFYRDFLGFAEEGRLFYPDNGRTELVFLKINDEQWIEVFDAAHVTHRTGLIYQVAFRTPEAEALRQQLARAGWPVPATVPRGQMKNANFTTRDPDGTVVELVQYLPEGRTQRDRGPQFLPPTRVGNYLLGIGIPTSHLSEALRLFRDTLGLEVQPHAAAAGEADSVTLRVPGSEDRLELEPAAGATPYFCLATPDLDVARAALEQRRARCGYHGALDVGQDASGQRTLTVADPEGIRVVLVQAPRASANHP